jgi:hypothetical protein
MRGGDSLLGFLAGGWPNTQRRLSGNDERRGTQPFEPMPSDTRVMCRVLGIPVPELVLHRT